MPKFRLAIVFGWLAAAGWLSPEVQAQQDAWAGYVHDPQHTGISAIASVPFSTIRWTTPVDLNPQYSSGDLFIHYGSPLITQANTVIVPVKTGASGGFQIEGRSGIDGGLKWTQTTDYILPPHNWTPSYSPTLTPSHRMYFAGAGGTVLYRDSLDASGLAPASRLAFFGTANYNANPTAYNNNVFINTPITSDSAGNIYFGFQVTGSTPLGLQSGLARIAPDGSTTYTSAITASGDAGMTKVLHNCAPALSNDGNTVYVAINNGSGGGGFTNGYLVALNSQTLAPIQSSPGVYERVALNDAASGSAAWLPDDGTAAPTVGPNGDVYFGVLENPFPNNHDRGWMLHFSGNLAQTKTPGAFGWDDTATIVPASMVPSYNGSSSYLIMTKYNNYAGVSGDGHNRVAILDPNATMTDPITGATVMKEVLTILGVTPDSDYPNKPGAVREWCINSAAVDPATKSILVNSEDGHLYRWDLTTNTFTEQKLLEPPTGEAYTPTLIGADGSTYAINNATLLAVGANTTRWIANANGNWSTGGNWSAGVPNGTSVAAAFGTAITAPRTVSLTSPITVGSLAFDNPNGYTIGGSSTLTINGGGAAAIVVTQGTQTISAPLSIAAGNTVTKIGSGILTISGTQSHGANSTLVVNTGLVNINTDAGAIGAENLAVNVNANAQVNFGSTQHLAGLTLGAGATAALTRPNGAAQQVLVTGSLSLNSTADLDLKDNSMVVHGGADPTGTFLAVEAKIKSAFNNSNLNGHGIKSSSIQDATITGLGSGLNSLMAQAFQGLTTFNGQPVVSSDTIVKYTYMGDATLDGVVNDDDVSLISGYYDNGHTSGHHWFEGDFTHDGLINDDDVSIISGNYNPGRTPLAARFLAAKYGAPFAASFERGLSAQAVPEPASATLLGLGLLVLLGMVAKRRQVVA